MVASPFGPKPSSEPHCVNPIRRCHTCAPILSGLVELRIRSTPLLELAAQQTSREHVRSLLVGAARRLEPGQGEGQTTIGSPVEPGRLTRHRGQPRPLSALAPCVAVRVVKPAIVRNAPRDVCWPLGETHTDGRHRLAILTVGEAALPVACPAAGCRRHQRRLGGAVMQRAERPRVCIVVVRWSRVSARCTPRTLLWEQGSRFKSCRPDYRSAIARASVRRWQVSAAEARTRHEPAGTAGR